MILELLKNDGLEPKRKTATEYGSACPWCGGKDKFISWPETDRWHCIRGCGRYGDVIQYLRELHGMSFQDAAAYAGKLLPALKKKAPANRKPKKQPEQWHDPAGKLVEFAHNNLLNDQDRLEWLKKERGLSLDTVKRYRLGWNYKNLFDKRERWGLKPELNDKGNPKKQFIPSGLVIPYLDRGKIVRVRIRRDDPGKMGRYLIVSGSSPTPMVIRKNYTDPVIIVESELDAILLKQEIRNPFTIISMGSAQIKPDEKLAAELKAVIFIFVCLDSDKAGAKQAHKYWLSEFDNAVRVPVPRKYGKDITEAHLNGLNLNMLAGVGYEFVIEMGEMQSDPD